MSSATASFFFKVWLLRDMGMWPGELHFPEFPSCGSWGQRPRRGCGEPAGRQEAASAGSHMLSLTCGPLPAAWGRPKTAAGLPWGLVQLLHLGGQVCVLRSARRARLLRAPPPPRSAAARGHGFSPALGLMLIRDPHLAAGLPPHCLSCGPSSLGGLPRHLPQLCKGRIPVTHLSPSLSVSISVSIVLL